MIGDWQDEWNLKRCGSDRSVSRHDTCRGAAYLNHSIEQTSSGLRPPSAAHVKRWAAPIAQKRADP